MTPEEVVSLARRSGSDGIAYTYNQPSIFIEFARDCGVIARKNGMFNIFVQKGYDTRETLKMMEEFLDCITVDFKGTAEPEFTRRYIGVPDPQPIFDTLKEIHHKTKIHVEITDLIVPEVGDNLEYARKLCKFVYDEFGADMPIHFLRFHPDYKMMEFDSTPSFCSQGEILGSELAYLLRTHRKRTCRAFLHIHFKRFHPDYKMMEFDSG